MKRQCCAKYRNSKQRDRIEYLRDWMRCLHTASLTIYGSMPQEDQALPWVAFVCKKHAETVNLVWIRNASFEEVCRILTATEREKYLSLFVEHDQSCLRQINNWRASRRARAGQREELIKQIAQNPAEAHQ